MILWEQKGGSLYHLWNNTGQEVLDQYRLIYN